MTAPQRSASLADGVHVADDDVGPVPDLQQRVGSAVDADEERAHLLQVAASAQDGEIVLVADAPNDEQHLTALEVDRHLGNVRVVDEQMAFLLDVGQGVLREPLELAAHGPAGFVEGDLQRRDALT